MHRDGERIAGYGAPGKANTLLNYCGIGPDLLPYTVDRNPYKQGRYTPGMRIPIDHPDRLRRERPSVIWILPWNLRTEIAEQLAAVADWGPQLFVAIPRPNPRARRRARRSSHRESRPPMKVVLFCGGQGLRLRDYAETVPKPMVPIGRVPCSGTSCATTRTSGTRTSSCASGTRRT